MLKGRSKEDSGNKIEVEDIKSGAFFITEVGSCDVLIIGSLFNDGETFMVNANSFIKIKYTEGIETKEGIVKWLNESNYEKRNARIVLD